jgi:predicted transcriptional regulator
VVVDIFVYRCSITGVVDQESSLSKANSNYGDLTDLQLAILDILWERQEATVSDVHDVLLEERGLAATTVATILSRLEKRGVITHRSEGRQYVYRALVSRSEVCDTMVTALTDRLFQGDVAALVTHLLTESDFSAGDLARVRRLIAAEADHQEEDHAE